MDRNIETYLRELQDAMASAGADPALVQDALFDAEEHLQAEMAAGGHFADVATAYGSPEEVAAAYLGTVPVRDMAVAIAAPHPGSAAGLATQAAQPEVEQAVEIGAATPAGEHAQSAVPGQTIVAPEAGVGWIEVGMATETAGASRPEVDVAAAETAERPAVSEPGPTAEPPKVFCRQCGTESVAGLAYCRRCGLPLVTPADLAAGSAAAGWAPPSQYPRGVQSGMAAAGAGRAQAEPSAWRSIFGPFVDARTWTSLVYMILSLGLGILYFVVIVTGLSISVSFMVSFVLLLVGVPLLLLVLGLVRGFALFEGRLVETLLGTRMPRRFRPLPPNIGFWERMLFWIKDSRTWLSVLYLLAMMPLGIVYFTVAVTFLATSIGLITSPIWGWFGDYTVVYNGITYVGDFPQALIPVAFIAGVLLLIGSMHAIRWIGRGHAAFAKAMLVRLK